MVGAMPQPLTWAHMPQSVRTRKGEMKRAALAWARKVTGKPLGWKAARKLLKKAKGYA
jgi:hypothetical protein